MNTRLRRTLAVLAASSALALTGCEGGDSTPSEPAADAGTGTGGVGTTGNTGEAGEEGMGQQNQPAPGLNQPLPDTGDDLESPTPGADGDGEDDDASDG